MVYLLKMKYSKEHYDEGTAQDYYNKKELKPKLLSLTLKEGKYRLDETLK